jgi:hypothetical protein
MNSMEIWEARGPNCTCESPVSSIPSICQVHCNCMQNGIRKYDPKIDGECRRCNRYPLYYPYYKEE